MTSVTLEQFPGNSVLNTDLAPDKCKITRGNSGSMFYAGKRNPGQTPCVHQQE